MKTPLSIKLIWTLSAFFLVGALGNVFGLWGAGNRAEAVFGSGIALLLFYYGWFFRSQRDETHRFLAWLVENRNALRSGTAFYKDSIVMMDTEVSQYLMVFSLIKVSFPMYSRPFIRDKENGQALWTAILFTLGTLLLGWWEFPWGPIYTIRAVYLNLKDGKRETVGSLLKEGTTAQEKKTGLITEA